MDHSPSSRIFFHIINNDEILLVIRSRWRSFNAFHCSSDLEAEILKLGQIKHVVKLGQFHGDADAYYVKSPQLVSGDEDGGDSEQLERPKLWTFQRGSVAHGIEADEILAETNVPMAGSKIYNLDGHPTVPYTKSDGSNNNKGNINKGSILIACDSLVYVEDLKLISYPSLFIMWIMGFDMVSPRGTPKPAPLWCKTSVKVMGVEIVRKWYNDILQMNWDCFVGAHGSPTTECSQADRTIIMDVINNEIMKNVVAGGGGVVE
jgi:hypothetical protein